MLSERDRQHHNQPAHTQQDEASRDAGEEPEPGDGVVDDHGDGYGEILMFDYLKDPDLNWLALLRRGKGEEGTSRPRN